ncbi:MAG: hypothetical protein ACREDY_12855, partial [Bradyrhizobium sp.]
PVGAGGIADGALWFAFESEPVKMLPKKFSGPPPLDDCACASPPNSSAAARMTAAVCLFANGPVRRVMFHLHRPELRALQEALPRFPSA